MNLWNPSAEYLCANELKPKHQLWSPPPQTTVSQWGDILLQEEKKESGTKQSQVLQLISTGTAFLTDRSTASLLILIRPKRALSTSGGHRGWNLTADLTRHWNNCSYNVEKSTYIWKNSEHFCGFTFWIVHDENTSQMKLEWMFQNEFPAVECVFGVMCMFQPSFPWKIFPEAEFQ